MEAFEVDCSSRRFVTLKSEGFKGEVQGIYRVVKASFVESSLV